MTVSVTQDAAFTALRGFIVAAAPSGTEVLRGQTNRVPMPASANWVLMTQLRRPVMSTAVRTETPPTAPIPATGTVINEVSTGLWFQVDVYGPLAADTAQTLATLFRSLWGTAQFAGTHLAPLDCTDPAQMPLIAGEQQWIQRWTMQMGLHGNIAVSVPQDFADTLITTLSEIDHV